MTLPVLRVLCLGAGVQSCPVLLLSSMGEPGAGFGHDCHGLCGA